MPTKIRNELDAVVRDSSASSFAPVKFWAAEFKHGTSFGNYECLGCSESAIIAER